MAQTSEDPERTNPLSNPPLTLAQTLSQNPKAKDKHPDLSAGALHPKLLQQIFPSKQDSKTAPVPTLTLQDIKN